MEEIQKIPDDWCIEIKQKGYVDKQISKGQLLLSTPSTPLVLYGFHEVDSVSFKYRKDKDETYCKLYISEERIPGRPSKKDKSIISFKWNNKKYGNRFPVEIEITTSEKMVKKHYFQIDVLTKCYDNAKNEDNFYYMINRIRDLCINPYRLPSKSRVPIGDDRYKPPISIEQFLIILEKNIINRLENIVYNISLNPHGEYIRENIRGVLNIVDGEILHDMLNRKETISIRDVYMSQEIKDIFTSNRIEYISSDIMIPRIKITYNVYENQLLKRFLTMLVICIKDAENYYIGVIERLEEDFEKDKKNISEFLYDDDDIEYKNEKLGTKKRQIRQYWNYINKCREFKIRIENMRYYSFLDDVIETDDITRSTSILQEDINYNRFYKILKEFLNMPDYYFSNILGLTILDLPVIYEYWTLLETINILYEKLDGWEIKDNPFKKIKRGYLLDFPQGKVMEFVRGNISVHVFYRESYRTILTESIRNITGKRADVEPDITIEIAINKILPKNSVLVVDSKYTGDLTYSGKENIRSPERILYTYSNIIGHLKEIPNIKEDGLQIGSLFIAYLGNDNITESHPRDPGTDIGFMNLYPMKGANMENIRKIVNVHIDKILFE